MWVGNGQVTQPLTLLYMFVSVSVCCGLILFSWCVPLLVICERDGQDDMYAAVQLSLDCAACMHRHNSSDDMSFIKCDDMSG